MTLGKSTTSENFWIILKNGSDSYSVEFKPSDRQIKVSKNSTVLFVLNGS